MIKFPRTFLVALQLCVLVSISGGVDSPPLPIIGPIVPRGLTPDVDGNDSTRIPFGDFADSRNIGQGYFRYQQIVSASELMEVPPSGAYLTYLYMRGQPCSPLNAATVLSNLTIRLSTSLRKPDDLSTNLDENIGVDQLLVYQAKRTSVYNSALCISPPTRPPNYFGDGFYFALSNAPGFHYSPSKGNLLIDIEYTRAMYQSSGSGGAVNDAVTASDDGVSRAYSYQSGDGIVVGRDTTGLAMQFAFIEPRIRVTSLPTSILLEWPGKSSLQSFRLQTTTEVLPKPLWKDYKGPLDENGGTISTLLNRTALSHTRYFRLFSDAVQSSP